MLSTDCYVCWFHSLSETLSAVNDSYVSGLPSMLETLTAVK